MATTQFRALSPISHGYVKTDDKGVQLKHPDGSFDVRTQEFAAGDVLENMSEGEIVALVTNGKAESFDAAKSAADARAAVAKAEAELAKANAAAVAAESEAVVKANEALAAHPQPAAAAATAVQPVAGVTPDPATRAVPPAQVTPKPATVGVEVQG